MAQSREVSAEGHVLAKSTPLATPQKHFPHISDTWDGMGNVFADERAPLQRFIDALDFEWLQNRSTTVRGIECTIRTDNFGAGQDNIAYEIRFSDSVSWVARIALPPFIDLPPPFSHRSSAEIQSEISTIEYVSRHTSIPVPKIYDYNIETRNGLGAPYILMEAINGRFVEHLCRIPEKFMRHVYAQVAGIVLQLSKLQFPHIGLLHRDDDASEYGIQGCIFEGYFRENAFSSSREFYSRRMHNFLQHRRRTDTLDRDWTVLAWMYMQSIPLLTVPELDNGPFPLRHPDLNNANIMYDDDYNIVGVIDWTATQTAPLQSFVVPPNDFRVKEGVKQRELYFEVFKQVEEAENPDTPLFVLMSNKRCLLTELVDSYWGYMRFPRESAMKLARLLYGDRTEWDDVKEMYQSSMSQDNE